MKKKIIGFGLIFALSCLLVGNLYAGWDETRPTNNEKYIDTPALIRANWDAIALGTDIDLQVTNAKVSATAGIVDTKLAAISTAGKVSGTALTGLASTPSGAGALPILNGGTGQTTSTAGLTALLPTQSGNAGKALITNATVQSWGYPAGLTIASSAQGDLLYNNGSAWVRLGYGTDGHVLKTQGVSANPAWTSTAPLAVGLVIASQAQGDIVYFNGTIWTRLGYGTSGQVLTTQGASSNPVWGDVANSKVFTSSGTFTAPAGITTVWVTLCGGGGGGAGTANNQISSAGGAGAWVDRVAANVTPTGEYAIVVGAGGAGGAAGANAGVAGGVSSFTGISSVTTVNGGGGGSKDYVAQSSEGGAGGTSTSVTTINGTNYPDGTGALGFIYTSTAGGKGGSGYEGTSGGYKGSGGGGNKYGRGAQGTENTTGNNGIGYGSGGSGVCSSGGSGTFAGGNGAPGFVLVEW